MSHPTDGDNGARSALLARQHGEQALAETRLALQRQGEQLELALARLRATLDTATDGILVTDEQMRVTDFNERFVQMWRLPDSALATQDHAGLLAAMGALLADPGDHQDRVMAIYREAPPTSFDLLQPRDGRVIERQSRRQVVAGRVAGRVWIFRDVTEQRRAEDSLRDETRMLELMNRVGRQLSATLELKSIVQAVTDAGTQISGARFGAFFYNADDERGGRLLAYTVSGLPREAMARFGRPATTGVFPPMAHGRQPARSDDLPHDAAVAEASPHRALFAADMAVRSYLAVPVVSRSGDIIGGLFFGHPRPGQFSGRAEKTLLGMAAQAAVAIDNARLYETAQQAAEERKVLLENERSARALAEHMSALKDEFLATLSHELRTPLSAILGWVHVLRRGVKNEQDLHKALATIERNARQQAQLIDDLLDMNRIATGKVQLDVQPVDPISFVEAALETVRPAADSKGLSIACELCPLMEPIPGDPRRLQQVISNLLSNAIKFTPRGGRVQVALRSLDGMVEIRVSDTGIGIKPDFVAHVFERFRQADASTTREYGGLGLGLSIVKNLVELHGGRVYAASPGEGRGATFCVQLPRALPSEADAANARAPTTQVATAFTTVDLSGLTVLVVDDDHDGRELARWVLSECQARVLAAADAGQALALLAQERPQVLVSDIGMPQTDGFALLKQVRALGPQQGGEVPAIALTAFARPEDRARALHAGFTAHLTKPLNPPQLLAAVAQAAGRPAQA
jgi:signal transduction histidine kinase/ActR/RegA family two-component response regulator